MSSNNLSRSHLSSPSYGYDFVVSTTQAAINKGLWQYLSSGKEQTVTQLCFLVNRDTGYPSEYISLEDLKKKTGGVNPFDIKPGTSYNDPRITALTAALFSTGLQLKLGPPPGVSPDNLPGIVSLAKGTKAVEFNMYFSEITVIQNNPPSGWGGSGHWNVWAQPSDQPWSLTTIVDILISDIDKELSTTYFEQHPEEKKALLEQLTGLESTGTAFSLQQLLFDLDNAALQGEVRFEGIPDGNPARDILADSTLELYTNYAKEQGKPLLALMALPHVEDKSQLKLTALERQVSFLKDSSGQEIKNPTDAELAVTTLDYLCATDGHPLPGATSFSWNWVTLDEVNRESGIIAINRNAFGNYIMNQLLPSCQETCIIAKPTVSTGPSGEVSYGCGEISNGAVPQQMTITSEGATVVHIEYVHDETARAQWGAYTGELRIIPHYTCDVDFGGTRITVKQHLLVDTYTEKWSSGVSCKAIDITVTESYDIKVNDGALEVIPVGPVHTVEDPQDPSVNGALESFIHIIEIINGIKAKIYNFSRPLIHEIKVDQLEKFIFPGGKVFSYSSVRFSDYQDLLCSITYL
ncbi:hypothetical protein F5Y14DRAFT_399421 [Nemania sp. NC0429]|nr:hypothetical protein F5Y14DRAFT_399421 [Nemania sp. NC0429]